MGITKLLRKIATGSSDACYIDEDNTSNSFTRPVGITTQLASIAVKHEGEDIVIQRNQDSDTRMSDLFTKTSRPCPPFCIQPMSISSGVETIGELEMLEYLQQANTDNSIMIVDSRIQEWVDKGTIPSSVHIPWTSLTFGNDTTLNTIITVLSKRFGVKVAKGANTGDIREALTNDKINDYLDFTNAKTLVVYCNGSWCGQTSEAIKALLHLSYPKEKLKYYRDGMQGWVSLGLTTIVSSDVCKTKEPVCKNAPYRVISSK